MSRTFAKKYFRAAIFSYLFSYLLVFCATLLVVSMTIIPRVRGSLALSCCFAKQPLLLPIWESECRSSCLIQVFIFIAFLNPTSTTWVLQVAVIYIVSCLLWWEWSGGQRHPILRRRSIFWLVEEDTLSTEGLKQRISFTWCKVSQWPTGTPRSPVEPGLVPGGMEEEGGHMWGAGLYRTWALAGSCPSTPAPHWAQPLFGHILPPGHRMPLSSCTAVQTWK